MKNSIRNKNGVFSGIKHLYYGAVFIYKKHPKLLWYCVFPMLISACFTILGIWLAVRFDEKLISFIWEKPAGADGWSDFGSWAMIFLWHALHFVIRVLSIFLGILIFIMLAVLFSSPFADLISEKIEVLEGWIDAKPYRLSFIIKDAARTILLETKKMFVKLMWLVILLSVSFILPVLGQVLYVFAGGYVYSRFAAMDFLDYCMARRGWKVKKRMNYYKEHKWAVLGFGGSILLLSAIPGVFIFLWPAAVCGGALLFNSLENDKIIKT